MRKLVFAALGYAAAITVAHYLLPYEYMPFIAAGCAMLSTAGLLFRSKARPVLLITLLSAAIGFVWTWGHNELFIKPAEELIGSIQSVEARVLDYPTVNDDYSSIEIRLIGEDLPSVRVVVYDYDGGFSELRPGDELEIKLKFISARERYNTESDYYISSGIYLRAYLEDGYAVTGTWKYSFLNAPKTLAYHLKAHVLDTFPDDVAPLMKALLTGDKSEYYDDDALYVAMKKAGFTHIIAVSGMHVSFIIGLLRLWTGRRRMTAFTGIPLIWFFAAMMGLSPSVVRAAVMMTLLLLAPIIRRENDAHTSLAAALLLLTLINPEAIGSLSLQLSFAAMAGIILVTPRVYRSLNSLFGGTKGIPAKLLRGLSSTLAASIGAIVFTIPLSALHFGWVPLYSLLTNVLCLWAMSTAFMFGYVACLIGAVYFPLGSALGRLLAWLPRYTIFVVKLIADLPYSVLYTYNNLFGWWLIFVYAVLMIPYLFKGKRAYRPTIPICCCVVTFLVITLFTANRSQDGLVVTAVDVGQGQCIVATTELGTVVIDCGGKGFSTNAGDAAAEYLFSNGRRSIDLLILTHLHSDHANGVVRLMNHMDVERLVLPEDCEDTEYRDSILKSCYDNDTEVYLITENTEMTVDSLTLDIFAPFGSEDPNEKGLIILGSENNFEFLVTGDAGDGTEKLLISFFELGDIELLVVGHHGSKYSTCDELLDATAPDVAFISVGNNSYGHPTEDVLERLELRGIDIYRTDLSGNISMIAGTENG